MTESATAQSGSGKAPASLNPNVPVGDEGKVSNKANSSVSFDDVDEAFYSNKPKAKRQTPKAPEGSPKVSGKVKEQVDDWDGAQDDEEKSEKPKAKKAEATEADAELPKEEKPSKKSKAHKFKIGDDYQEIAADALVTVTVDGQKREVPLQDVLNTFSGETFHAEKLTKLDNERKEFLKQRESLNSMVSDLYQRVQKDPDAGFDFLADLTGQDPIKLKENMLRQQLTQLKALREMSDDDLETYVKDQVRDWRDKHFESRTKGEEARKQKEAEDREKSQLFERYSISPEQYERVKNYIVEENRNIPNFKVTNEHIVQVDRSIMAYQTIKDIVPHVANHANFDKIMGSIVTNLVNDPSITQADLAKVLKSEFGEDREGLKKLSRKATEIAKSAQGEGIRGKKNADKDPLNFDDMD